MHGEAAKDSLARAEFKADLDIRCISSEVYGNTDAGTPNQWVGDLTTADVNYENGIVLNYTLINKETYLWQQ